ncbi:hypothetical protein BGW36DRAFT_130725 [Talaromyces proteolyticus]|uniref:Uncharacterized protein n=1 Tax=Talaromyces proteolyticus TaxID=1131652 RepID=A0AAD4Q2M3_9EURO|nr:uncharacterized protein BGW36DRAFT_130725 [Talaromyces proteolyticus]KAH8700536.1 hypothetical protein BGW36DRAFT_130725 [Talaromyces proteolyticus]
MQEAVQAGHPALQVLKLSVHISDEKSVTRALSETGENFGRLDILVNNARGIVSPCWDRPVVLVVYVGDQC